MKVKTKKVVTGIEFTEDEKNFLRSLANVFKTECDNNPDTCETCPFHDAICYMSETTGLGLSATLNSLAKLGANLGIQSD